MNRCGAGWAVALGLAALSGCATPPAAVDPGGCPRALRRAVAVSVSVSPIAPPPGPLARAGAVPLIAGTERRLLLAVHVARFAPRVRVLADSLDLLTYGGTLAGWVRVVRPRGAEHHESLGADGGWLEIVPFLPGSELHSRTETIDLQVIPGGHRRAILVVRPSALWSRNGRPYLARNVTLHFSAALHMTRLHAVDATATFHFKVQHLGGAREQWQCASTRNFTLVTRQQALPDLWLLRSRFAPHGPAATLGVSDPQRGAFALVFPDPQSARALARWIRQRHARRIGRELLGLLGAPHRFVALPQHTVEHLQVRQWGAR